MLAFLVTGAAYGIGAGTMRTLVDGVNAVVKTFAGLAGLIFLFLVMSQFIAYFNYSNMATITAVNMADWLKSAGFPTLVLLFGFVVVIAILDIVLTGSIPKWAIFAPIFVPLFMQLGVGPELVLAAYRVGDSPMNPVTPMMPYFPMIVVFAQKYDKNAGVGTIVSHDAAVHRRAARRVDAAAGGLVPARDSARPVLSQPPRPGGDARSRAPLPGVRRTSPDPEPE